MEKEPESKTGRIANTIVSTILFGLGFVFCFGYFIQGLIPDAVVGDLGVVFAAVLPTIGGAGMLIQRAQAGEPEFPATYPMAALMVSFGLFMGWLFLGRPHLG